MRTFQTPIIIILGVLFAGSLHAQDLHWRPMSGMHGSYTDALTVTPNGMVYTASNAAYLTVQPGFFRSSDRGNTWRFISRVRPNYWVNSMLAVNDSVLLANFGSNNEYFGTDFDTLGIYRSQDSGRTWKIVLNRAGTLLGTGAGSIIVRTDSLRRSTDLGQTWISFNPPASVVIVPVASGVLAYNNDSLLHYTTDFKTWRVIFTNKPKNYFSMVTQMHDGMLAIFSDSLYLSSDNGATWSSHRVNYHSQGNNFAPICFLRNGNIIGNYDGEFLCHSSDSGQNWIPIYNGPVSNDTYFGVDSLNNAFFGIAGDELIRVSDTSTGTVECDPSNMPISNLAVMKNSFLVAAIGPEVSILTSNDGDTWNNLLPLQAFTEWFGYNLRAGLFAQSFGNQQISDSGLLHSPDGISWGELSPFPYAVGSLLDGFDNIGDVFFSNGSVTTDDGETWLSQEPPPGRQVIGLPDGSCVTASNGALYRSTNVGLNWQETPSAVLTGDVSCIACDSSGTIMICLAPGAFISSDQGKNWASVSNGLPADSIAHQILYSTEGFWLAATGRGVFMLKEGESSWQSASNGLDDPDILCIDMGGPGKYYVGTSLAGIYTTEAIQSSVSGSNVSLSEPALEIFPNPFSQSTTLTFTSEAAGYANVSIVNLLGSEVAHLFSGELAAGEHSFPWSKPAGLPDGMYECLVRVNGYMEALPLVVAR